MSIGNRLIFRKTADQTVTASVTPVAMTDMSVPIAANQTMHVKFWIPFTVGASGGFRFLIDVPAGGTSFLASLQAVDGVTAAPGSQVAVVQAAAAAFANAWAVAGSHYAEIHATIVNGATAGNVSLQFACNSAAGAIVAEGGSILEATILD